MPPRFANPFLVSQKYELVSRTDLYPENVTLGKVEMSNGKLKMLQQLIESTTMFPSFTHDICDPIVSSEETDNPASEEVLFRLISSSLKPAPISLLPRPPPPSVSREPNAEDTHEEAITRRQYSEAVSVDGSAILRGSQLSQRPKLDEDVVVPHAGTLIPAPPLLLITTKQQLRKTRPPVSPVELAYYPYNSNPAAINPRSQRDVKSCPILDLDFMQRNTEKSTRRHRRKKLKESKQDRLLPKFWKPNASWSGPCKGYAYGYFCQSTSIN